MFDSLDYSGTAHFALDGRADPTTLDMALSINADDKKWIKEQIKDPIRAFEDRIAKRLEEFQSRADEALRLATPRGGKRIALFLKEWSLTAAAVSVLIACITVALGALYVAMNLVNQNAEFRGSANKRLDSIEATLRVLTAAIAG
jgi:hypothetical protein